MTEDISHVFVSRCSHGSSQGVTASYTSIKRCCTVSVCSPSGTTSSHPPNVRDEGANGLMGMNKDMRPKAQHNTIGMQHIRYLNWVPKLLQHAHHVNHAVHVMNYVC